MGWRIERSRTVTLTPAVIMDFTNTKLERLDKRIEELATQDEYKEAVKRSIHTNPISKAIIKQVIAATGSKQSLLISLFSCWVNIK